MVKKVKLGGHNTTNVLAVEIEGKTYNVPLAGSMKRKDLLALKSEDDVFKMFATYIPAEILDEMTMDEYRQLGEAWASANDDANNASLGES